MSVTVRRISVAAAPCYAACEGCAGDAAYDIFIGPSIASSVCRPCLQKLETCVAAFLELEGGFDGPKPKIKARRR